MMRRGRDHGCFLICAALLGGVPCLAQETPGGLPTDNVLCPCYSFQNEYER